MFKYYFIVASYVLAITRNIAIVCANPGPMAEPQILPGNESSESSNGYSGDEIVFVANGEDDNEQRMPVPAIGERVWAPLVQPSIAYEAQVVSAPPGIGCFFISNPNLEGTTDEPPTSGRRSRPQGFSSSSRPSRSSSRSSRSSRSSGFSWSVSSPVEYPFVSPTFYSSGSAARGEAVTFDPPFLAPAQVSCFHLPVNDQQQIEENTVAVLMDLYTPDGRGIITPDVSAEDRAAAVSVFEAMTLQEDVLQSTGETIMSANREWAKTPLTMARAAIVHEPREKASAITCRVFRLISPSRLGHVDFTVARQLLRPFESSQLVLCQDSPVFNINT